MNYGINLDGCKATFNIWQSKWECPDSRLAENLNEFCPLSDMDSAVWMGDPVARLMHRAAQLFKAKPMVPRAKNAPDNILL